VDALEHPAGNVRELGPHGRAVVVAETHPAADADAEVRMMRQTHERDHLHRIALRFAQFVVHERQHVGAE